jgi:hypothetical protein
MWMLIAVGVLMLALAAPALARTAAGERPSGWIGGLCQEVGSMAGALAELFGLTTDDLAEARQEGKSLSEIGQERGVTEGEILSTMLEARKKALDTAVAEGRITQERADAMLERMQGRMKARMDQPAGGGCDDGGRGGGGPGSGAKGKWGGGGCGPGPGNPPAAEGTSI